MTRPPSHEGDRLWDIALEENIVPVALESSGPTSTYDLCCFGVMKA
jgi:hypothetical protein